MRRACWQGELGPRSPEPFHFTETITGAQISGTEAVFKIRDSRIGRGAGDQLVKMSGLGGTDTETTYYGDASAKSNGSFKLGAPDSNGNSQLTGKGHDTSGTGKLKGFKSTYSYTGTFNTKTLVFTAVLKGTGSNDLAPLASRGGAAHGETGAELESGENRTPLSARVADHRNCIRTARRIGDPRRAKPHDGHRANAFVGTVCFTPERCNRRGNRFRSQCQPRLTRASATEGASAGGAGRLLGHVRREVAHNE